MVSDDLGSQAVRYSFDPSGKNFDARQVVLNAFLAGNDLLYMDRILATNDLNTYTTIRNILDFFVQKYREDSAFADRVDVSVARILALKYRIYPTFDIDMVKPNPHDVSDIGKNERISFEVAAKSITLLSPDKRDLANSIPQPPNTRSNMVFFTDQLEFTQCSQCKKQTILAVDEFQKTIVKLYGPDAGGLVNPNRLYSYSLKDLNDYLDSPLNHLDMDSNINKADWIIFALRSLDSQQPTSSGLHRLISERPQLMRDKKVIAFAFNTPYRLDATDISNLTAYYGVYSKTNSFVEIAARVIFQEVHPQGASPVSVPGIAYDLNLVTSPDAQQLISLMIEGNENRSAQSAGQPTLAPVFYIGDSIPLKTGTILDHNGHPVPDGTVVKFLFQLTGEKRVAQQVESMTKEGVARMNFRIQDPGLLEIKVTSEPAINSDILRLEITPGKSIVVSAITPTSIPTSISTSEEKDLNINIEKEKSTKVRFEWLIVFLMLWVLAGALFWLGGRFGNLQRGIQAGLSAVIGGFGIYLWLILGLPGSSLFYSRTLTTLLLVVLMGSFIGILMSWFLFRKSKSSPNK